MTEDRTDSQIRALMIELVDATPTPPTWESIQARLAETTDTNLDTEALPTTGDATMTTTDLEPGADAVDDLPEYAKHEERRTARWRPIAAATGAVGVLIGGTFAYAAFNGTDGASSPEAAVEQFVQSVTDEDLIGAFETLPPSERQILTDAAQELTGEAERLGLSSGLDTGDVAGFDFEVEGLTLRAEPLGEEVVAVHLDGTLVSNTTGTELPLSDAVFDAITDDDSLAGFEARADDLSRVFDEQDVFVVAIKEDGGWHSSAWYTIAEYIRRDQEQPLPAFGASPVQPTGADSPEQAVEQFFQATLDGDLPTALGLMAPGESRVLYDYGPLFFDEATQSAEDMPRNATVNRLDLEVAGDGDTRTVALTGGDYIVEQSDGGTYGVSFDEECVRYVGTPGPDDEYGEPYDDESCRDDASTEGFEPWEWDSAFGAEYVAVLQDGRWYLSPARSVSTTVVTGARLVPDGWMTPDRIDTGAPYGLLFRFMNLLGGTGGFGMGALSGTSMGDSCYSEIAEDGTETTYCDEGSTEFEAVGTPIETDSVPTTAVFPATTIVPTEGTEATTVETIEAVGTPIEPDAGPGTTVADPTATTDAGAQSADDGPTG